MSVDLASILRSEANRSVRGLVFSAFAEDQAALWKRGPLCEYSRIVISLERSVSDVIQASGMDVKI